MGVPAQVADEPTTQDALSNAAGLAASVQARLANGESIGANITIPVEARERLMVALGGGQ